MLLVTRTVHLPYVTIVVQAGVETSVTVSSLFGQYKRGVPTVVECCGVTSPRWPSETMTIGFFFLLSLEGASK